MLQLLPGDGLSGLGMAIESDLPADSFTGKKPGQELSVPCPRVYNGGWEEGQGSTGWVGDQSGCLATGTRAAIPNAAGYHTGKGEGWEAPKVRADAGWIQFSFKGAAVGQIE